MKRGIPMVLLGLSLAPLWTGGRLAAQDRTWNYKVELFGDIAHSGFYNGDHKWGSGRDFGGGAGVRPFAGRLRGLGFEVRTGSVAEDDTARTTTLDARFVAANALYHFRGRTRVQPYVLGGIGVVRAHRFRFCGNCVATKDPVTGALTPLPYTEDIRATKQGVTAGAGIKVAVHRRVSIRPELFFVDTTPGRGWNWAWVRFQLGVGFHF
jgi:opacity protein-like surface antigen